MIRFIGQETLHYTSAQTSLVTTVENKERFSLLDALNRFLEAPTSRARNCEIGILTDSGCRMVFSFNYSEAKALKKDVEVSIREFRE